MSIGLQEKKFSTLFLIVLVGIIIGSYLNTLISMIPIGQNNVVKTFFTYNFIDFGYTNPFMINLDAIKIQFGFQIKFSLLSILGIILSLYFFRWYR
ncbi:MAG: DUF4321 domain-containing protein [Chitinivibrionales bacterium]|nr:DUF4321 domain-containing protein [Chitinivibrionales bacterium]